MTTQSTSYRLITPASFTIEYYKDHSKALSKLVGSTAINTFNEFFTWTTTEVPEFFLRNEYISARYDTIKINYEASKEHLGKAAPYASDEQIIKWMALKLKVEGVPPIYGEIEHENILKESYVKFSNLYYQELINNTKRIYADMTSNNQYAKYDFKSFLQPSTIAKFAYFIHDVASIVFESIRYFAFLANRLFIDLLSLSGLTAKVPSKPDEELNKFMNSVSIKGVAAIRRATTSNEELKEIIEGKYTQSQ